MEVRYFQYMGIRNQRYSQYSGIRLRELDLMLEVTRGWVDNENNSQSDIQTYWIWYKVGVYIYESESIAIRNRKISEYGLEHRKVMCTARETQECYVGIQNRNRNRNLKQKHWGRYWWFLSLSAELNSGNLGSQCEAVIVVLQGLMSSKVELVEGVW